MSRRFLTPLNVYHSATAPSSPVLGDVYFNTVDKTLYTYDGSTWIAGSSGTGSQGIQGIQGIQGNDGPQGIQGPQGPALEDIDGGSASSEYGGIDPIDAGNA